MSRMLTPLIYGLLFHFLSAPAEAAKLKVPSTLYPTIQSAVDAAMDGDTVLISKGVYAESVTIEFKGQLTLKMNGGGTARIAPSSGNGINIIGCAEVKLSGLQIESPSGSGVLIESSAWITIDKCRMLNNGRHGIRATDSEQLVFRRNKLRGNGSGSLIALVDEVGQISHVLIEKNTVQDSARYGILIKGNHNTVRSNRIERSADDGIRVDGLQDLIVKNKVFDAGDDGIQIEGYDISVLSNTVMRSEGDGVYLDGCFASTVAKNKIGKSGDDGIATSGDTNICSIRQNRIKDAGDDGVSEESSIGTNGYFWNRVTRATIGFRIDSDNNIVESNRVSKCEELDLANGCGYEGNTYKGNNFKKIEMEN